MKNSSPRHNGFTLIELIISIAIFMVLIVGIYGLSITSVKNNRSGEIKQITALYGQKIFEDFRSKDIQKTLTKSGSDYVLTFSNGLKLTGDSSYEVTDYDLKDGYKADITVTKNNSAIGSGQALEGVESDDSFTVNFKKNSLESAFMSTNKDDGEATPVDSTKSTEIDVNVDADGNGKTITVKIAGSTNSFSKNFPFSEAQKETDKKKEIRLSINCSEYNLNNDAKKVDQGFEVHVFNHDIVPLNLCLQKTNTIDGTAVSEAGAYRLYNNRSSSEPISEGDLYDITVEVKKTDDPKNEIIFRGEISQNLRIIDKTVNK